METVMMYRADDGSLHESREDAERHEVAVQIERFMRPAWPTSFCHDMAVWIAAHGEELSTILRYPILAKKTVDEYLGVKDEEKQQEVDP